jgi:hypothetical protein
LDVHRPILTVLEGAEAIEHEGLVGDHAGSARLVKKETVAAQPFR